ncbi:citryl-CoA lyase [Ramlibacter henchirensis]|uniref:citrate synthase (unknown stereospecificity) n=1 Tax=Ramlibacter henchirensis TaxID=204072 RepID=A0A4Z0BQL0_9BURK|nr:citryl-CoA lyase [Ramlibacter henchirensis]TFZ00690.1 citryl-CoA lyase [Ramlibacter henchirensis]
MSSSINKIGKSTVPRTAISTSDEHSITVRGEDLCRDLIGRISFTDYFSLLVTGKRPSQADAMVLDATLVAIAEHGLVPSVQASRMTYAAAPDALQGAVAAGILGCGSVILGASETAGRLFTEVDEAAKGKDLAAAAREVVRRWREAKQPIPGYGHPLHKERDPRVARLFEVAKQAGSSLRFVEIAEAVEKVIPEIVGKDLRLNVSAAIPAVLLGTNFPLRALRGVPILARCAGLIAHLTEEAVNPSGFALSYQATRELVYEGEPPAKEAAK